MKSTFKSPWLLTLMILSLIISALGSAPTPAYAAGSITVNSNADTTVDDGMCTLREAVANANGDSQLYTTAGECAAGSGTDTISFDSSLSGTTIYLQSTLSITTNMTIDGSALTSQITISGDSDNNGTRDVRVFSVSSGATVTLNNLTITNGNVSGIPGGGGIFNDVGATLTITNSTIADNSNSSGPGGGIRNDGTLTVTNSTISGNTATTSGGGIRNIGTLTVTNSTFSGNSAGVTGSGGGIYNVAGFVSITITNSTFSGNSAGSQGGGIYTAGGTFNYANTIIANSTSGGDCATDGTVGVNINNLVENGGCSAALSGDPVLDALLSSNGGPTQTFALLTGSPAINAGDNTVCDDNPGPNNLDQRGVTRPVNVTCDIGAYELGPIVTKLADTNDGICDSDCSLREAIATVSSEDTVTFDSSLSGGTIHLGSTLNIVQNMTVDGSALASKITVSGDTDSNGTADVRVFFVHSGMTVTLDSLIITKGTGTGINMEDSTTGGGGIQNNSGNTSGVVLTVKNSVISDSTADKGGGIYNRDQSTITIINSTISGNTATGDGGGILSNGTLTVTGSTISGNSSGATSTGDGNQGGGGIRDGSTTTITNSTISGNYANNGYGGGILNNGNLTAKNNTISGNSASISNGGGIYSNNVFNATNNIIANSTFGGDCVGQIDTNLNNLVEDGSCFDNHINFLSGDPMLDALADNGGSTQTLALVLGSPAIDAGDDTTCAASPVNNLDQRGVTRPAGAHCDIGAFEGAKDITAPTVTAFTVTTPSSSLDIPITAFTASDNVAVTGYLITESSSQPASGASGWSASAPTTYTVASAGSHTLYPWAKDAAGNVSAVFGSPVQVKVIAKLSFTSTGSQDGWILESSETSNKGGTLNSSATTFYLGDDTIKKQYRVILSFNTSSLPDTATITKVTLKLRKQGVAGGGDPVSIFQGFVTEVKKGTFSTSALQIGDFSVTANKTIGSQSPALVSGWYSLNLTSAKNVINKLTTGGGLTQIRLRFSLDDNNNAIANYLKLYSGNAGAASRPQLIVEYVP